MTLEEPIRLVKSEMARLLLWLASTHIVRDTLYTPTNTNSKPSGPYFHIGKFNTTRFELVRKLNFHRKRCDINSYWTQDGRIIVKPTEQSHPREFKTISTESDIYRLLGVPPHDENEFEIEHKHLNCLFTNFITMFHKNYLLIHFYY